MSGTRPILERLYRAEGDFVARTDESAAQLGELQRLGYVVEHHPLRGLRLVQSPDRLMAEDLRARVTPRVIGREILVFEETGSTNDVAARLAAGGRAEGTVVFAEMQTRGRGRHGRAWVSPKGKGLWFSVLLRPRFAMPRLTIAASVAVARVVGEPARIKWPNDVMWAGRKLAGILSEARGNTAMLGVGLNVHAADWPAGATCLEQAAGQRQDRIAVAARLLAELDRCYQQAAEEFDVIREEWAARCTTLGRQLVVTMGARRIEAQAYALDETGALILRKDNGQTERILGADVTVEHG